MLRACAHAAGTRVVKAVFHSFEPLGVTGLLLLEESHVSIHTWPEQRYAAADFYTCGEGEPLLAQKILRDALRATRSEVRLLERGVLPTC